MMNIVFRADASRDIGSGHVMRCLSLAAELEQRDASVRFVCRGFDGHLCDWIERNGYPVSRLSTVESVVGREPVSADWLGVDWRCDAEETMSAIAALGDKPDWLIVDHYGIDRSWEEVVRPSVGRIMVIDDLADREHDCDLILDQNLHKDACARYRGRLPELCRALIGPRYALLREEFVKARTTIVKRRGRVRNIFVFFGGSDPLNLTAVSVTALARLGVANLSVDVVIGAQHRSRVEIEKACSDYGFNCHIQTQNIAELMAGADLAIGAGGSATWERCCVGLPCITFVIAENQRALVDGAANAGMLIPSNADPRNVAAVTEQIMDCIGNPERLANISKAAMASVDGRGCNRVARAMGIYSLYIRLADEADSARLLEWRNHPTVRRLSHDSEPIKISTHRKWLEQVLSDTDRQLLIGEFRDQPVGVVRFDIGKNTAEISIYMVPGKSGQGFGTELLLAAEHWLLKMKPNVQQLHAEVLEKNVQSQRLFTSAGYSGKGTTFLKRSH